MLINRLIKLSLTLLLGLSFAVYSQTFEGDDNESISTQEASQNNAETASNETGQEANTAAAPTLPGPINSGNFDPFTPSEDISEDYSVPFPVDI